MTGKRQGRSKFPSLTRRKLGEVKVPLLDKEGSGEVKVPLLDKEGSGEVKIPLLNNEGLGIVTVDWTTEATLVADPLGNVYWGLAGGRDANGKYRGYAVTLNAETGEVVRLAPQMGSSRFTPPPHWRPVRQGLKPAIYLLPVALGLALMLGIARW
ncbi:MAG: hypothetical protein RMK49_17435 [Abditibacteriales bacterium]|nr:hypothetical protein [Abditibacteriales bacterium]